MSDPDRCDLPRFTVRDLLDAETADLGLRLLSGRRGLDRIVSSTHVQKPGLTLAGAAETFPAGGLQVLGRPEVDYLADRPPERRVEAVAELLGQDTACLVVGDGADPALELREGCDRADHPLLVSPAPAGELVERLEETLHRRLAPRMSVHGTLMDLYGLGILLLGESGVGKSESALDLITRGHRLISDDVVRVHRIGESIVGTGPELTRYHMEVRGVGLLNVKDLFGVAAVRRTKDVELVIRLESWKEGKEYDRLGLDESTHDILGVTLPLLELPVAPGRNLAMLLEVAARNQLLKQKGYHPARELSGRVRREMGPARSPVGADRKES